jgi:Ala-tRNA(Pro) deacylase
MNMTIAHTLERYLDAKNVKYDVIAHPPTSSSIETVETCRIPGERLAKAVLLRDEVGYALAVLPASHHIRLAELRRQFGDDVALASEHEIEDLFEDCVRGAVPAVGECYGLDTLVDESIEEQPEVFFEAGDHATLVRMSSRQFANLTAAARHARYSAPHWCQI